MLSFLLEKVSHRDRLRTPWCAIHLAHGPIEPASSYQRTLSAIVTSYEKWELAPAKYL
jgi:hypothetical protein